MSQAARHAYEFGPFSLDVDRRLMLRGDQVVPLTSKAFQTLLVLVQNHSRVVDKDELLKLIWPDTMVEERNLTVNISTLRKALGESPEAHEYIVTVPGQGYRFVTPVRELRGQATIEKIGEEAATAKGNDGSGASAAAVPAPTRGHLRSRQVWLGAILLAALTGTFALGRFSSTRPARPAMRFSAITNFAGVEGQPAISPDGRWVAFVSDRGGPYDIWVGLLSGGSLVRVTNDPNVKSRPRWSPDGSKLVYARLNEFGLWDVWTIPALGGVPRKLATNAADPTWLPDGRWIAYANLTTGNIWMCDAVGREAHSLTSPEVPVRHRQPAFSHDGRRLAFVRRIATGGPYGEVAVAEAGGKQTRSLTDDAAFVGSPAWSADGGFIYFASGRGGTINVWKVDARGGPPEQITVGQGDDADLDVSAVGQRIVFSSYRTNINLEEISLHDTGASKRRWLTSDPAHSELAPAYSRDGKRIAYFANRRGSENETVWVMEADGSNPMPLAQDDRINAYPRWSGDDRFLIHTSRTAGTGANRLWGQIELRRANLSGGTPEQVPFKIVDPTGDVSRQGQFLYRGESRSVQVFDPKTNQVQLLKDVRGAYLRWCPDGLRFAAMVNPRELNDVAAGVWIYDLAGKRQQVFSGWAAFYAWAGPDELLILEGKPDLNATLWRVRLDGSPKVDIGSIRLIYSYWHNVLLTRFDVHPDGRRIVAESLELHQADLSMVENIQ